MKSTTLFAYWDKANPGNAMCDGRDCPKISEGASSDATIGMVTGAIVAVILVATVVLVMRKRNKKG